MSRRNRVKVAPVMKLPGIFYRCVLVLALLFAQMGGLLHGITHALAEQSQDQSQPHDKRCDLCAAYAQVGSALGSSPVSFAAVEQGCCYAADHLASACLPSFAAFSARAPPSHA